MEAVQFFTSLIANNGIKLLYEKSEGIKTVL
jgi:hypothetical protein